MRRVPRIQPGTRFGRLTVLSDEPNRADPKHPTYRCRCDCGQETTVQRDNFARTRSCGCLRIEELVARSTTHGMSYTPEFKSWCDMRDRCYRVTKKQFKDWGGRGITVCQRWLDSFENFYADMGPRPTPKHTIERVNNDGNYEPSNCIWATRLQQNNNRRPRKKKHL